MIATRGLGRGGGELALFGFGVTQAPEPQRSSGGYVRHYTYIPPEKKKKLKRLIEKADVALLSGSVPLLREMDRRIDEVQAEFLSLSRLDAEIKVLLEALEARERDIEDLLFLMLM